jgi:hypothetical protein
MLTDGWFVQVEALAPPPGWTLKPIWLAPAMVMVSGLLVTPVSPVALALRV